MHRLQSAIDKKLYFSRGDEHWIVLVPLLGIAMLAIEPLLSMHINFDRFGKFEDFFINIFLFNSLHLICPFLVLGYWPSGRAYVRRKLTRPKFLLATALVMIVVAIAAVATVNDRLFEGSVYGAIFTGTLLWVWILLPTYHGAKQSWGLSIMISKSAEKDADPVSKARLKDFVAREKNFMRLHTASVVLSTILARSEILGDAWVGSICALSLALSFHYSYLCWKEEAFQPTNKFLFSLRFILWSLAAYSILAMMFVITSHALEYVAMMRKSSAGQDLPALAVRNVVIVFVAVILLYEFTRLAFKMGVDNSFVYHPLMFVVWAFYPFFTLMHYITDSVIYRSSDPDSQGAFSAFLVGFESAGRVER